MQVEIANAEISPVSVLKRVEKRGEEMRSNVIEDAWHGIPFHLNS